MYFLLCMFFNDTASTEIYTLSLHDALPIFVAVLGNHDYESGNPDEVKQILCDAGITLLDGDAVEIRGVGLDRKSTRLNSSHPSISYAVFCLKKKKKEISLQSYTKS